MTNQSVNQLRYRKVNICRICNKAILDESKLVFCDCCLEYYCPECVKIYDYEDGYKLSFCVECVKGNTKNEVIISY